MTRARYIMATVAALATVIAGSIPVAPRLVWNASASVPIGFYIIAPVDRLEVPDSIEIEREVISVDDFDLPRAWRLHGRVWAYNEYRQSVLKGVQSVLTEEEKLISSDTFDLPGSGSRVRGDIFQAAHVMMVKKLVGSEYHQLLHCVDGDNPSGY